MENIEKLINSLRNRKGIKNLRLAKSIETQHNKMSFDVKRDGKKMTKNDEKSERVLYSLFDDETLSLIRSYDMKIMKLIGSITRDNNWHLQSWDYSFIMRDHFKNMHDHEFREWDTYEIKRVPGQGYETYTDDPYNGYFKYIKGVEENFLLEHIEDLNALDDVLTKKEKLLSGNFGLKDESDREFAMELIYFLGLLKEKDRTKDVQYNKLK